MPPQPHTITQAQPTQAKSQPRPQYNPFIIEEVFPDPLAGLRTFFKPLPEIAGMCLYAVDANVLLAVYLLDRAGFEDVQKHFRELINAERLFIPVQAAREFLRHRSRYVAQAFDELEKLTSTFPKAPPTREYPLFAALPEYAELVKADKAVREAIDGYKAKAKALVATGREINNNDEVSKFYAALFGPAQVIDHAMTKEELLRVSNKTPPTVAG